MLKDITSQTGVKETDKRERMRSNQCGWRKDKEVVQSVRKWGLGNVNDKELAS